MSQNLVSKTVKLSPVTKNDSQEALDAMEELFDRYRLSDEDRLALWQHYQTFACDVLLRFGQFSPDIWYDEQNGHA